MFTPFFGLSMALPGPAMRSVLGSDDWLAGAMTLAGGGLSMALPGPAKAADDDESKTKATATRDGENENLFIDKLL
jgi:hypothetical protein